MPRATTHDPLLTQSLLPKFPKGTQRHRVGICILGRVNLTCLWRAPPELSKQCHPTPAAFLFLPPPKAPRWGDPHPSYLLALQALSLHLRDKPDVSKAGGAFLIVTLAPLQGAQAHSLPEGSSFWLVSDFTPFSVGKALYPARVIRTVLPHSQRQRLSQLHNPISVWVRDSNHGWLHHLPPSPVPREVLPAPRHPAEKWQTFQQRVLCSLCAYAYTYIHTHTCVCTYIYIYTFFFRFFSIMGYYKIVSIVPCTIQ